MVRTAHPQVRPAEIPPKPSAEALIEAIVNSIGIETRLINPKTTTSLDVMIGLPADEEFSFVAELDSLGDDRLRQIVYPFLKRSPSEFSIKDFAVDLLGADMSGAPRFQYFKILADGEPFIIVRGPAGAWIANKNGHEVAVIRRDILRIVEDRAGTPFWIVKDRTENKIDYFLLQNWDKSLTLKALYNPDGVVPVKFAPNNEEIAYLKKENRNFYISRIGLKTNRDLGEFSLGSEGFKDVIDYTYSNAENKIGFITLEQAGRNEVYKLYIEGNPVFSKSEPLNNLGLKFIDGKSNTICLWDKKLILYNDKPYVEQALQTSITTAVIGNNKTDYFTADGEPFFVIVQKSGDSLFYSVLNGSSTIGRFSFIPSKQVSFLNEQRIDIETNLIENVYFDPSKLFVGIIRNATIDLFLNNSRQRLANAGLGFRFANNRFISHFDTLYKLSYVPYFADLILKKTLPKTSPNKEAEPPPPAAPVKTKPAAKSAPAKPRAGSKGPEAKRAVAVEPAVESKTIFLSIPSYIKPRLFWSDNGKRYGVIFAFSNMAAGKSGDKRRLSSIREDIIETDNPVCQVMINDRIMPFLSGGENPKIVFAENTDHFAFVGKDGPEGEEFVVTDRFISSQRMEKILDLKIVGNTVIGLGVRKVKKDRKDVYQVIKISSALD